MDIDVVNNLGMPFPAELTALPDLNEIALGADDDVPEDLHVDAVFTHTWGGTNLATLLERGPRWIHVMGVGVDRFPLDLLGPDQTLTCARGATKTPISEFALACMLAQAKALPEAWIDAPPDTGWFSGQKLSGLHGRTVVIVGVGGIGAEIARLCLAFGMRVIGVRRNELPPPHPEMEITTSLAAVVAEADHLVLAAPATAATNHLVDREILAAATPGLHIVNIARGSLIDQDALREALDDGRIARASLDTVDPEPLPVDHWMFNHPSVRLSPHVSWAGPGSTGSMFDAFVTNYHHFRAGEPLEGVVDVGAGY